MFLMEDVFQTICTPHDFYLCQYDKAQVLIFMILLYICIKDTSGSFDDFYRYEKNYNVSIILFLNAMSFFITSERDNGKNIVPREFLWQHCLLYSLCFQPSFPLPFAKIIFFPISCVLLHTNINHCLNLITFVNKTCFIQFADMYEQ